MMISIGITQFFTIGFLLSLNKNQFKAAALVHAIVLCASNYLIFSRQPWKPKEVIPIKRLHELKKNTRKVWNDEKEDVEMIEDIPVMNELKADQITKRLSQTLIPVLQLCDK